MAGALNHTSTVGIHPDETLLPELLQGEGLRDRPLRQVAPRHPARRSSRPATASTSGSACRTRTTTARSTRPSAASRRCRSTTTTRSIERDPDQSQFTQRFTERAVGFIEANKDEPFFLYVPHVMPHVPIFASERFKGKSGRGLYGDVVEELDWSVGEILDGAQGQRPRRRTRS